MCLQAQGIDEDNGNIDRVRRECGISNDGGGISIGRGIDDVSKVSETTTVASMIQGRRWRLQRRDDGPE